VFKVSPDGLLRINGAPKAWTLTPARKALKEGNVAKACTLYKQQLELNLKHKFPYWSIVHSMRGKFTVEQIKEHAGPYKHTDAGLVDALFTWKEAHPTEAKPSGSEPAEAVAAAAPARKKKATAAAAAAAAAAGAVGAPAPAPTLAAPLRVINLPSRFLSFRTAPAVPGADTPVPDAPAPAPIIPPIKEDYRSLVFMPKLVNLAREVGVTARLSMDEYLVMELSLEAGNQTSTLSSNSPDYDSKVSTLYSNLVQLSKDAEGKRNCVPGYLMEKASLEQQMQRLEQQRQRLEQQLSALTAELHIAQAPPQPVKMESLFAEPPDGDEDATAKLGEDGGGKRLAKRGREDPEDVEDEEDEEEEDGVQDEEVVMEADAPSSEGIPPWPGAEMMEEAPMQEGE